MFLGFYIRKNDFATRVYFCVYLVFYWVNIIKKVLRKVVKNQGYRKEIKRGIQPTGWRGQTFAHIGEPFKSDENAYFMLKALFVLRY